jgi:hypothetical protein
MASLKEKRLHRAYKVSYKLPPDDYLYVPEGKQRRKGHLYTRSLLERCSLLHVLLPITPQKRRVAIEKERTAISY